MAEHTLEYVKELMSKEMVVTGAALCMILIICGIVLRSYLVKKKKSDKSTEKSAEETVAENRERTALEKEEGWKDSESRDFRIGKVHEIGARSDQQDSFFVSDDTGDGQKSVLAVVADGMGGLSNGGAVSSMVVRTCMEVFYQQPEVSSAQDTLLRMAMAANRQINLMLQGQIRSGSTLVSAIIKDGYLYFLTIGDSRIYLYRNGALLVLNREHVYQEEIALRVVNQADALERVKTDPQINSLTSYIGSGNLSHLDRNREGIKLKEGDKIILSTDGVFGTLSQDQMEDALRSEATEAAEQMRRMVMEADKPRQDNYTAVILEYREQIT